MKDLLANRLVTSLTSDRPRHLETSIMTSSLSASGKVGTVLFLLKRVDCNDGVASYLETLMIGFAARGWRIILFTGPVYEKDAAAIRYNSLTNLASKWIVSEDLSSTLRGFRAMPSLLGAVREFGVDIVHTQGLSVLPYTALLRIVTGTTVVTSYLPSVHGEDPKTLKSDRSIVEILRYMLVLLMCRPDCIIAFSSEVFRFFHISCRLPSRFLAKIMLGVDTDHFRAPSPSERVAARSRLGINPSDIAIVLPGRLNWNKGHDLLIAAGTELARKHPEIVFRCIMPGTGQQSQSIKQAALEASGDARRFIFPGYVADMREVYFAADIAVLPSRLEAFPLVVVEAMACGLPVIRTPSGGFEDQIIEGVNGFGVPFNDETALTAKIAALFDEAVRHKMGAAALQHSRQFESRKMISDTEALYDRLISGRRAGKSLLASDA
jgi:glycosyltransferase involved in cell wall biosynthesis